MKFVESLVCENALLWTPQIALERFERGRLRISSKDHKRNTSMSTIRLLSFFAR